MRSIAPLLRCDPARLERIRSKQRASEEIEMRMRGSSSIPFSVELAGEYRSTPPAPHIMAERTTTLEPRANEGQINKEHLKRKAFDTQIRKDIQQQASRATKRMRASDVKPEPMHANKNLEHADREHHIRHAGEFKSTRQKVEDGAIQRLITGKWYEPPAGKHQSDK